MYKKNPNLELEQFNVPSEIYAAFPQFGAFLQAIASQNKEKVDDILQNNAELGVNFGMRAAIHYGNWHIIKLLLKHPTFNANFIDAQGNTYLHLACRDNRTKLIDFLTAPLKIEGNRKKVNFNTPNNEGRTPLMELMIGFIHSLDYLDTIEDFVHKNFFDPNIKDNKNLTIQNYFLKAICENEKNITPAIRLKIKSIENRILMMTKIFGAITLSTPKVSTKEKVNKKNNQLQTTSIESQKLSDTYSQYIAEFEITNISSRQILDASKIKSACQELNTAISKKKAGNKNHSNHKNIIIINNKTIGKIVDEINQLEEKIKTKKDEISKLKENIAPHLNSMQIIDLRSDIGAIKVKNAEILKLIELRNKEIDKIKNEIKKDKFVSALKYINKTLNFDDFIISAPPIDLNNNNNNIDSINEAPIEHIENPILNEESDLTSNATLLTDISKTFNFDDFVISTPLININNDHINSFNEPPIERIKKYILNEESDLALNAIISFSQNATYDKMQELLDYSIEKNNLKVINALTEYEFFSKHIVYADALFKNKPNICQEFMLQATFDINLPDNHGKTPLHYACSFYDFSIIESLLSKSNIKINIQDKLGNTPLIDLASDLKTHPQYLDAIYLFFKQAELDWDIKNADRRTAIDYLNEAPIFINNNSDETIRNKVDFIKNRINNAVSENENEVDDYYTNNTDTATNYASSDDEESLPNKKLTKTQSIYGFLSFFASSPSSKLKSNESSVFDKEKETAESKNNNNSPIIEEKKEKISIWAQVKNKAKNVYLPFNKGSKKTENKKNDSNFSLPKSRSLTHFSAVLPSKWFNNYFSSNNLRIKPIEFKKYPGFNSYSYVDTAAFQFIHPGFKEFVERKIKHGFGQKDIRKLKDNNIEYFCWVNEPENESENEPGNELKIRTKVEYPLTYEIKYKDTTDRILGFAKKADDDNRDIVIIFCLYLKGGLHTPAQMRNVSKSYHDITLHLPKDRRELNEKQPSNDVVLSHNHPTRYNR